MTPVDEENDEPLDPKEEADLEDDEEDVLDEAISEDEEFCEECDEPLGLDDSGNDICINNECPKFQIPVLYEEE